MVTATKKRNKKATKPKGRRGDAVKKKNSPKKKKVSKKQGELFEKRSPKHKQICDLAKQAYDDKVQAEQWKADAEASRDKLTALLRKEGIKGPYNADGIKVKPQTTQEKHTCKLEAIANVETDFGD